MFSSTNDHFPVLSCFSLSSQCNTSYVTVSRRMYSNDNINTLREDRKNLKWNSDLINIEVENLLNAYMDKFNI